MVDSSYDLVVIGAGPGGYVAALRAAELGMRVACVDKQWLGGTCLNVGCIPSKALLESSSQYQMAISTYPDHGISFSGVALDLQAMMARKKKVVGTMTKGIASLFKKHNVEFFSGSGSIPRSGCVLVSDGEQSYKLVTERILIATGSVPIELESLPFDGQRIISSTEALEMSEPPPRLVVIGAGAIGLEMGSIWARLGSDVLVVEFTDTILPDADREIATRLKSVLGRQGIKFELCTAAERAELGDTEVRLTIVRSDDQRQVVACDRVLVAVGRQPFHSGVGLANLGVAVDRRDFVTVNENYETTVKGIFAIGDAICGPMLAHKAESEGAVAVERMAGIFGSVNYDAIPNVVYTHPELASVGKTEEQLIAAGVNFKVGKHPFRANARAHCIDATEGLVKVLVEAESDRILGIHILGSDASHLIAEGVLAMEFGASAEDIARTVHAHPTLAEVVREAAAEVA